MISRRSFSRDLLALLDQAADAGAAVDRERGSVDRDGDPTGWGELMAGLALRLRMDVQGPAGRD